VWPLVKKMLESALFQAHEEATSLDAVDPVGREG
jgi:hypothetical protein